MCVGGGVLLCPRDPPRAPLSPGGPGKTGGTRVQPPLRRGGRRSVPSKPHGASPWGAPLEALRWNPPLLAEILITSWFPTQNLLT